MELIPGLPEEIARECLVRVSYDRFRLASWVCRGWKDEIESPEFHRRRKAGGLARAVVVVTQAEQNRALGLGKFSATPAYRLTFYEPETGTWGKLPPIPGCPGGLPLFCQCVGVGRRLAVVGGWSPATWEVTRAVFVYDFVSETWRRGADMPGESRSFFACASDSDRMVFIAGGHDEEKNALKSALAYDVAKDEWIPLPDMAKQRDECKGICHRGKFHVIGGYPTEMQGRFERSAEAFDFATWQWDRLEEDVLDCGTCPRTCVMGENEMLHRCGTGHVAVRQDAGWLEFAEIPVEVRTAPYVVTWRQKLLVIGSAKFGGPHMVYELDLRSGAWTKVDVPEEFSGHVQAGCCVEI